MPNTLLRNPVNMNSTSASVSLTVTGTPAASTSDNGVQPAQTMLVQGTAGQATTGTGKTGGTGANISIVAGAGGAAPSGSTKGAGGSITINPGSPGTGGGTASTHGNICLASLGGNVGIGTDAPGKPLDLMGDFRARGLGGGQILYGWPGGAAALRMWALSTETVNVKTDGVTYFNGGSVGIGTNAPGSKLHVVNGGVQVGTPTGGDKGNGSINVSGDIYKNGTPLIASLQKSLAQITALTKRIARLEVTLARATAKRKTDTAKAAKTKAPKRKTNKRATSKEKR
jgi:hypothetical protein